MVRAIRRLLVLLLVDAVLFPVALSSRLLQLVGARDTAVRFASGVLRLWGRLSLWACGIRVEVRGNVPRNATLVCSNHLSYVDIPLLASLFGGRFIAKAEIARWPLFGVLSRSIGTIFVAPRRRAELARTAVELERTLHEGIPVVLFPEGGASRGARVERLHSALLQGPVREGLPCLPVCIHYEPIVTEPEGARGGAAWTVCWWGGMDLWLHAFRLAALEGVQARVTIGEPVVGSDRKELALELHRRMTDVFVPVSQAPVPVDNPWPHLVEGGVAARRD